MNAEYLKYHSSERMKMERAARNKARRMMMEKGRVRKGDGKHVDHRDGDPMNGAASNLHVMSAHANRVKQ